MPLHFIRNIETYEKEDAILFHTINFDDITFSVFAGERGLRHIAKHVVQLRETPRTDDELVALFRWRLQPIASEASKLKPPQVSVFLLNEAMWVGAYLLGFPGALLAALAVPTFHVIYMFG